MAGSFPAPGAGGAQLSPFYGMPVVASPTVPVSATPVALLSVVGKGIITSVFAHLPTSSLTMVYNIEIDGVTLSDITVTTNVGSGTTSSATISPNFTFKRSLRVLGRINSGSPGSMSIAYILQ